MRKTENAMGGLTVLREIWYEWKKNGDQQQDRNWKLLIENAMREKKQIKKKDDGNYGQPILDGRMPRGEQQCAAIQK